MALKILLASMDKPRTMVLIQEENGQNVQSTITDYLQNKGFDLVDPAQAAALKAKDDPFIQKAVEGDPVAAAKLGAENGAEYVVVGSVRKSLMGGEVVKGTGMKSGRRALRSKSSTAPTVGSSRPRRPMAPRFTSPTRSPCPRRPSRQRKP